MNVLRNRTPVILMYHGFSRTRHVDDPENLLVVDTAFGDQLDYLLGRGWQPLTLSEWLDIRAGRTTRPRRSFLVTIDDGLASVGELAIGVLAERGVPCALFIPVGLAGKTAEWLPHPPDLPIMSKAQLLTLRSPLVDFGVHGWDHTSLRGCAPGDLDLHVRTARDELASWLGTPPRVFCYPYGDHDQVAREAVEAAGYEVALSVFDDCGRFAISRVDVNATDTLRSMRAKILPGYRRTWRISRRVAPLRRAARWALTRRRESGE